MSDEIVEALGRREENTQGLGEVLHGYLGAYEEYDRLTEGHRAARVWFGVNGDIERAHTTGVFVPEPRRGQSHPELVVYVDSRARATDFLANREVYLARMQAVGLEFTDIKFKLSKYPTAKKEKESRVTSKTCPQPLEPLSSSEKDEILQLTKDLPDGLREAVQKAMENSYRLQKTE